METISLFLTQKFLERNIIRQDCREICKMGIELILSDIINFSLILIIGVIIRSFISACIYLLLFWTVRKFSGGFHAKTYGVCRAVTIGTYLLVLLANRMIGEHLIVYTGIFDLFTLVTMFLFSPVRHPNKELTAKEVCANRFFSLLASLFFTVCSIILVLLGRKEGLVISLTLFAIAILMYAGLLTNRKEGAQNGKCNR